MKKDLKHYLSLNYPMILVWDADDKVFFVEFPDLPGCMAHGKTPDEAVDLAHKIKKEWLMDALKSFKPSEPTQNGKDRKLATFAFDGFPWGV
ncbi:MAG: type II toxin-antitoxin system HicB family antitoxin, partial [Deltaproteobacteria bacterium]|nr:type II toxin-antitoxin system HicB family antitoxin [Deltaproteobacteria bacterium]